MVIYLITLSVASYFHFLLGHGFSIIEEWIVDYFWEIVSFSKMSALFLVVGILGVQSSRRYPFREFLLDIPQAFSKEIYVIIIFFFIFVVTLSDSINEIGYHFKISAFLATFLGTYIFYMSDIFAFTFISTFYPDNKRYRYLILLFIAIIHYWFCRSLFVFAKSIDIILLCNTFIMLCLSRWRGLNWFYPSWFCLLYVCPAAVFLDLDIVRSSGHSFLDLSAPLTVSIYIVLTVIAVTYIHWKDRG